MVKQEYNSLDTKAQNQPVNTTNELPHISAAPLEEYDDENYCIGEVYDFDEEHYGYSKYFYI